VTRSSASSFRSDAVAVNASGEIDQSAANDITWPRLQPAAVVLAKPEYGAMIAVTS